jgi:hypothetical protein
MFLLVGMCVAELDSGYFHIGMPHLDGIYYLVLGMMRTISLN